MLKHIAKTLAFFPYERLSLAVLLWERPAQLPPLNHFYAPVLTAGDFIREVYISGKFFQYGLALKTGEPEYNNDINGGFTFDIMLRNNKEVTNRKSPCRGVAEDAVRRLERGGA
jgi:hypothetical protein